MDLLFRLTINWFEVKAALDIVQCRGRSCNVKILMVKWIGICPSVFREIKPSAAQRLGETLAFGDFVSNQLS